MTSLLTTTKQIPLNSGYYITLSSISTSVYDLRVGSTDTEPGFIGSAYAQTLNSPNQVLRDEGKTLRSSGRVFRKVQLMVASGSVQNGGTDGVSTGLVAVAPNTGYYTVYIELPGNPSSGAGPVTPVARLG